MPFLSINCITNLYSASTISRLSKVLASYLTLGHLDMIWLICCLIMVTTLIVSPAQNGDTMDSSSSHLSEKSGCVKSKVLVSPIIKISVSLIK